MVVPQGYNPVCTSVSPYHQTELGVDTNTRKTRATKRNEKGQLPIKVGGRSDYRVFKFGSSVSDKDAALRTDRLKEVYEACGGWNELSNSIAEHVRNGVVPVPLPALDLSQYLGVTYWRHLELLLPP